MLGQVVTKEEKAPLSEIFQVLNDRFGTNFTDEDRFFFEQIREKAANDEQVIKLRRANPFDKFQLGLRSVLENLIVQRMTENDAIVTRYMDDAEFGSAAFEALSKAIYDAISPDRPERLRETLPLFDFLASLHSCSCERVFSLIFCRIDSACFWNALACSNR